MQAAQSAVTQIFSAVLASSVTVITVFIPLVLIPGLQGLLFTPFAVMVMVAVGISLLVAVTTVPMLATRLWPNEYPRPNGGPKSAYARFSASFDRGYERFAERYKQFLQWAIDHPAPVFTAAAIIFFLTLGALKFGVVATELFPPTNSRFASFTLRMPVGTALNVTNAVTRDVETRLRNDPRVVDVASSVGSGGFGGGGGGRIQTNQSQVQVTLKPGTSSNDAGLFVTMWQTGLTGPRARGGGGGKISPEQRA